MNSGYVEQVHLLLSAQQCIYWQNNCYLDTYYFISAVLYVYYNNKCCMKMKYIKAFYLSATLQAIMNSLRIINLISYVTVSVSIVYVAVMLIMC